MQSILWVFATEGESAGIRQRLDLQAQGNARYTGTWAGQSLTLIHTGIGMTNTAYVLGEHLARHHVDLAINLGIAGSYDPALPLGQVVEIVEDCFAEMGAEDGPTQLDLTELGFPLFRSGGQVYFNCLKNPRPGAWDLPQVRGISVNLVRGHEPTISQTRNRWPAQVESMEGAAFFLAMLRSDTPFLAFRAISNYVTRRQRSEWRIPQALAALESFLQGALADGLRQQ